MLDIPTFLLDILKFFGKRWKLKEKQKENYLQTCY